MRRHQLFLSLGLALFLVGCSESVPPAEFPTTPDAAGTGQVDSVRSDADFPKIAPESPKNLVVPDVKEPKPAESAPKLDVDGGPADDDAESALDESDLEDIKKLPADLQALAIQQVRCPISGEHLGSMGKPVVQKVEGKTLFLCCGGCIEELEQDPKAALAKLPKK